MKFRRREEPPINASAKHQTGRRSKKLNAIINDQTKHGTIMQREQRKKMALRALLHAAIALLQCKMFAASPLAAIHESLISIFNENIGATWNPCDILMSLFRLSARAH
jgi:hypothetical protein